MKVLFAISAHGYGHGAISVQVVEDLWKIDPDTAIVLHTQLSLPWLEQRLSRPFHWTGSGQDFGMVMRSSIEVDRQASCAAFADIEQNWEQLVAAERQLLHELAPDVVVANVSYLAMAAAHLEGIPAVTLCPFNWLDIYEVYCNRPGARLPGLLRDAYATAALHIRPEPSLPLPPEWPLLSVGPIRGRGSNCGEKLRIHLGRPKACLILVAAGAGVLATDRLPEVDGWHWLVAGSDRPERDDATGVDELPFSFPDLVASVDLVLTKTGYGICTEAVAAGVPLLVVERPDWPESLYLERFARKHVGYASLEIGAAFGKRLVVSIRRLLERGRSAGYPASGAREAAVAIRSLVSEA